MVNKNIAIIGAGIAAFFLLGETKALEGGGASEETARKATVMTGISPPIPSSKKADSSIYSQSYSGTYTDMAGNSITRDQAMNSGVIDRDATAVEKYLSGTQEMFKQFNYPTMHLTGGGTRYEDQQIYSPIPTKKNMTTSEVLAQRQEQVIVAPQSYLDRVSTPSKKTIVRNTPVKNIAQRGSQGGF